MNLDLVLSVAVMLIGLIVLLVQRRFNELVWGCFIVGLLAVLLRFGGSISLHAG